MFAVDIARTNADTKGDGIWHNLHTNSVCFVAFTSTSRSWRNSYNHGLGFCGTFLRRVVHTIPSLACSLHTFLAPTS
jgi:hypothetical protein